MASFIMNEMNKLYFSIIIQQNNLNVLIAILRRWELYIQGALLVPQLVGLRKILNNEKNGPSSISGVAEIIQQCLILVDSWVLIILHYFARVCSSYPLFTFNTTTVLVLRQSDLCHSLRWKTTLVVCCGGVC